MEAIDNAALFSYASFEFHRFHLIARITLFKLCFRVQVFNFEQIANISSQFLNISITFFKHNPFPSQSLPDEERKLT